ncbi:type II secretion system F family protein [Blastococcus sp. SYSU D01042]
MSAPAWLGAVLCLAAVAALVAAFVVPARTRVPLTRLDPTAQQAPSRLAGAAESTTAFVDRVLAREKRRERLEAELEKAGITMRPAEFLLVTAGAAAGAGAFGLLLGGALGAFLLVLAAPAGAYLFVGIRRRRRAAAFAAQLDDSLQLLSGSLRAGHSILRAIDAVSRDTQSPTSDEFARVVNETRVGRDVNDALAEVAERVGSEDFAWVVQAIGIHREVGGNLAEVLDRVADTIRDRAELRREAVALSAEGRVSGTVLLVMPVGVTLVLAMVAPDYLATLFASTGGLVVVGIAATLMVVGAVWLRALVKVRF